ncbi:MAG: capsule biosynthesis protein, partial [Sphingomicrobium sp.]
HLLKGASLVVADADDDLALIAAIAGVPVEGVGEGRFASLTGAKSDAATLRALFRAHLVDGLHYLDVFSGMPATLAQAIEQVAFWRALIDGNRGIEAAMGFAPWKRASVAPLLWNGEPVRFLGKVDSLACGAEVAIWRSRCAPALLDELERLGATTIEVEDGFVRSEGLGADCVPPLSIVVDRRGAHFDPRSPSDLEEILRSHDFPAALTARARRLREVIVAAGVSKYGTGQATLERPTTGRHVLVPGQVEDDRSVMSGGGAITTNIALLRRARDLEPDAFITYKPHPDVEAGHRIGAIPDALCLTLADRIVRDEPISALIDSADDLHVNTSLAGFEALLRGKAVTTHGVPFYAGWGLTRDLGPVPERRDVTRSLDELVAAVLLLYPRYLDPITGLPCPPEVLIDRLSRPATLPRDGLLVKLRRLQGLGKRMVAATRGSRS